MQRLIGDDASHEIVVTVPGVVLGPGDAVFDTGIRISLTPPKWLLIAVPVAIGATMSLLKLSMSLLCSALVVVLGGLALVLGLWRLRRLREDRARRDHVRTRFGGQALGWRLDETEIRQTGPFLDTAVPWSAFVHVLDQPHAFVFVLSGATVMILPRRLLSETQQADVRALIDRARDRGLIGDMPADLTPSWDLIRDGVRERYGA